jgi:phospholipase C
VRSIVAGSANLVDHTVTDQASILRFIEDNWDLGRLGDASFDHVSGSLTNMFDFDSPANADPYRLDPKTGLLTK